MLASWIPWSYLVRHAARVYGVIDPAAVLARIRRFSQPSEVQEPIELLRAGLIFQARGLVNTRAIQFNLDWVWPFWVEKQFNPDDLSFIPRSFSFTHVNLTHRDWTVAGLPDIPLYPLVDPRGLVTPLFDGWSMDFWIISSDGPSLLPSKLNVVKQVLDLDFGHSIQTVCRHGGQELETSVSLEMVEGHPLLLIKANGLSENGGWLAASLRPYNPEGIQFIDKIEYLSNPPGWRVNGETRVDFSESPEKVVFSNYRQGDALKKIDLPPDRTQISCKVGLATSVALFSLAPKIEKSVFIRVPLGEELRHTFPRAITTSRGWPDALAETAELRLPDNNLSFLYQAAVRSLLMLSAHEIFPGPYNYRRFWFRDACIMMNALLAIGLEDRCKAQIDRFPDKQKKSGYYQSQQGEWDSNGQVLWIMNRFQQVTRKDIPAPWLVSMIRGANWIVRKRIRKQPGSAHQGLLPAGFSAEHFGPNDYYYWDDFWGIAGLRAAANLLEKAGTNHVGRDYFGEAADFERRVFQTIEEIPLKQRTSGGIPASPYRRMDAGAIGCLIADWPLQITPPDDPRISGTLHFLIENCFHKGGFFQDMVHSGINAYLTLAIAQTLLRKEDRRYRDLIRTVADLASPTGNWPEASHPFSGGGCMGDGQHGWAAAEWVLMIRNLFVREEGNRLILGSGVFPEWLASGQNFGFGPTPTPYGRVTVDFIQAEHGLFLHPNFEWYNDPCDVEIRVPGYKHQRIDCSNGPYVLEPAMQ